MISYTKLKAAMADLGYTMSDGDGWTANDDYHYRSYLYLNQTGITTYIGKMGHQYTSLLPGDFPGVDGSEPGPDANLESIAITGYSDPLAPESTVQLVATGTYDDASTADVTAQATWSSGDEGVATVNAGLVTGVSAGAATITATIDSVSGTQEITVAAAPELVGVTLSAPSGVELEAAGTSQLVATAEYDDTSTADVTSEITNWTSSDEGIVTVSIDGLVTAVDAGQATVTGTYQGQELTGVEFTVS